MLATNMIRKDLQSAKIYEVGIALSSLSCFVTPDLARDLVNDIVNLVSFRTIGEEIAFLAELKSAVREEEGGAAVV